MATRNNPKFLYRRRLSKPVSELLADPFSGLTRKRQTTLLIASTVTLLLSVELVTLTEVGVSDVKFTLSTPQIATWLAFAVTFYMLIVYLLNVRADWAIAKAKGWLPFASIEDVKAAMISDREDEMQANLKRQEEFECLKNERDRITKQMQLRRDEVLSRNKAIIDPIISKIKLFDEERDRLKPVEKAMDELMAEVSFKPDYSLKESLEIAPIIKSFSRLTKLRILVEIMFPAAYAVFALIWTVKNM